MFPSATLFAGQTQDRASGMSTFFLVVPKRGLGDWTPLPCSCGGGAFRSGMQSPTGALGGLSSTSEEFVDDGEKASDNGDEQSNKTAEN